ncbi:DUF4198 domain-containing protein [Isosphaeraceae bacterium EP7]
MKMFRNVLLPMLLVVTPLLAAQAHTLRVLVTRPVSVKGFKSTVYLSYGHLLPVDELIPGNEVGAYLIHAPDGSTKPLETSGTSLHANEVSFDQPGLYQLAVTRLPITYVAYTDASGAARFARLPKDQFKLPEGAKLTASARSYQFSKAVVLNDLTESKATPALGHALEIVVEGKPTKDGYSADESVRARVLFKGKPLAGVKLSAASTSRNPDGIPEVAGETDSEGRVALDLPEPGTWVLDVLHLIESSPDVRASYDNERFVATMAIPVADK